MLLVAWCIVKEEKGLHVSLGQVVENVNGVIYLGKQVAGFKPSIPLCYVLIGMFTPTWSYVTTGNMALRNLLGVLGFE